ncbi:MAG: UDP-N-acetylmuramoyl-L-alanyl-D-glutamate--2,6-diaminopimelate ligase [Acidimicrobiia bacterium]
MAISSRSVQQLVDVVGGSLVAPETGQIEVSVVDVTHDSRQAGSGILFVAIRGAQADGHGFVSGAVATGSPAVCVDHPTGSAVMEIVVPDTRSALGPLAASVHGDPSQAMKVIGVTGTNGKTTVTHYIESITSSAGLSTGLIGTIHTRIGDEAVRSVHTTPEASDFQRLLARMRDNGAELAAVEVSSHALELGRVAATTFAVAAFTNFSQDHLDFHGDMDSYRAAKMKLFEDYEVGTAVVNIDDEVGKEIARSFHGSLLRVGEDGEIRYGGMTPTARGTSFRLTTPWGSVELTAPVLGSFNVDNAVLAAACSLAAGLDFDEVVSGLQSLEGVPGRFEVVSGDDSVRVIVDYAHTPEGILEAVATARGLGGRRVIALVGAGGDRDQAKRPLMGSPVSRADLAIVTSDNPRSEDPAAIADAVVSGLDISTESIVDLDRSSAISKAINAADDGDIVLILGRGHEPLQEVAGEMRPFDDREVAREALSRRWMSAGSAPGSGSMDR